MNSNTLSSDFFKKKIEDIKIKKHNDINTFCERLHQNLIELANDGVNLYKYNQIVMDVENVRYEKEVKSILEDKGWDIQDMGEAKDQYSISLKLK